MIWNRSNTIGMARVACPWCHGYGLRVIRKTLEAPCACVLRAIFRACYHRFRECDALSEHTGAVSLEFLPGAARVRVYSRKREEFMSDFDLVSRRALNDFDYRLFRYHFMLGADWKLCCRQLKMSRAAFFRNIYRIEERLGRIYAELTPYPLYPVDDYFGVTIHETKAA